MARTFRERDTGHTPGADGRQAFPPTVCYITI